MIKGVGTQLVSQDASQIKKKGGGGRYPATTVNTITGLRREKGALGVGTQLAQSTQLQIKKKGALGVGTRLPNQETIQKINIKGLHPLH